MHHGLDEQKDQANECKGGKQPDDDELVRFAVFEIPFPVRAVLYAEKCRQNALDYLNQGRG